MLNSLLLSQVPGSWSMLATHGTKAVSFAAAVSSLLAPSPLSQIRMITTVCLAMKTSLPLAALDANR